MKLHQLLDRDFILYDGAMGTELLKWVDGVTIPMPIIVDQLNLTSSDLVLRTHMAYVDAGADIIKTNTFLARPHSTDPSDDFLPPSFIDINAEGALLARRAADSIDRPIFVAGSMGPVHPKAWAYTNSDIYHAYYMQAHTLLRYGADFLLLETQYRMDTLDHAIKASRDAMKDIDDYRPIHVSFAPERVTDNGSPRGWDMLPTHLRWANKMGADILGTNCYPVQYAHIPAKITYNSPTKKPRALMPNAGYPDYYDNTQVAEYTAKQAFAHRIQFVGTCCGTSPESTKLLAEALEVVRV